MFVLCTVRFLLILQLFKTCIHAEVTDTNSTSNFTQENNAAINNTVKLIKIELPEEHKPNLTELLKGDDKNVTFTQVKAETDTPVNNVTVPVTTLPTNEHYGREGITISDLNNLVQTNQSNTPSSTTPTYLNTSTTALSSTASTLNISTTEKIIPVSETLTTLDDMVSPVSHGRVVPKKGVAFPDNINYTEILSKLQFNSSTSTTVVTTTRPLTTEKQKPKKPTVTIGSDEQQVLAKENSSSTPKVPSFENYEKDEERGNKSNFVIPIVAVIFSVPLVAIVLNVLYKRGKEWWAHRHYSRMDFLIDGMYNN